MNKIKAAMIGVGSISDLHIRAYLNNDNVELTAFCDINEKRLREMGKKYGVTRLFTDVRELCRMEEIDAVSVCTWNSAHAECAIAALDAGKHVLCEKPTAVNARQAIEMQKAAARNDRILMIGFVRRFGRDVEILKDFLDIGYFGELYYAKAVYLRRKGNPGGWFGDRSRSGGGPLIDLGVHVIDQVRYLAGLPNPVSVYGVTFQKLFDRKTVKGAAQYLASETASHDICDVEDMVSAIIRFDNGLALSVETSFSLNIKEDIGSVELFGDKAGAKLDPQLEIFNEQNGYLTNVGFAAPTSISVEKLFQREIDHFVDCIVKGIPCRAPAEDGVAIMKILDAVYESARTGHEVVIR